MNAPRSPDPAVSGDPTGGAERKRADGSTAAAVARLASDTGRMLRGRLSGLRLELDDGGIVLRGTAHSFYAKQLALHAIMAGTRLPVVRNEIEVVLSVTRTRRGS